MLELTDDLREQMLLDEDFDGTITEAFWECRPLLVILPDEVRLVVLDEAGLVHEDMLDYSPTDTPQDWRKAAEEMLARWGETYEGYEYVWDWRYELAIHRKLLDDGSSVEVVWRAEVFENEHERHLMRGWPPDVEGDDPDDPPIDFFTEVRRCDDDDLLPGTFYYAPEEYASYAREPEQEARKMLDAARVVIASGTSCDLVSDYSLWRMARAAERQQADLENMGYVRARAKDTQWQLALEPEHQFETAARTIKTTGGVCVALGLVGHTDDWNIVARYRSTDGDGYNRDDWECVDDLDDDEIAIMAQAMARLGG